MKIAAVSLLCVLLLKVDFGWAQPQPAISALGDILIPLCSQTSLELAKLDSTTDAGPCILYDITAPSLNETSQNEFKNSNSSRVTMIQVTPTSCNDHRDGMVTAVKVLNNDNEGRGVAIGYNEDHYVQFRLVSVIAGNSDALDPAKYDARHVDMLRFLIESLDPQYIIGTCSWKASLEEQVALEYKKILMAQVGPEKYYTSGNRYVFGFHMDSNLFPQAAVQSLRFHAERTKSFHEQPVKVVYRNQSDFFSSTCRAARDSLKQLGFMRVDEIEYDPSADNNTDGIVNEFDRNFLHSIADEACPPGSEHATVHPAIFMCTLIEQDILLERWKQNGCRPLSLWSTSASLGWATDNLHLVPYLQGGCQWHESFDYSDPYFNSGKDLLDYDEEQYGYRGSYNHVAGYSLVVLFSQHIAAHYRVIDNPKVEDDFASPEGYEQLRRSLLVLTADTLFGPFALNKRQRNNGREPAGSQWLPLATTLNGTAEYRSHCTAPSSEAEALAVIPAPVATYCPAGQYTSVHLMQTGDSLMSSKCLPCPVDTLQLGAKADLQCTACPEGSSTEGKEGSTHCIQQNPNLIPSGLKAVGYTFVFIVWSLALFFIGWLTKHRADPVVRISQYQFLILICIGAMISSSSIIALSFQADVGEDTTVASRACMTIPFLYTIGWILEYSSLCAKSYRLYQVTNPKANFRKVTVSAFSMYRVIAIAVVLDLSLVLTWTIVSPLQYLRQVTDTNLHDERHLVTVNSFGQCQNGEGEVSEWAFLGPILLLHFMLMVATNVMLWKNRLLEDRYQELRYVAMASVYALEIIVIGIPVIAAVGDNSAARFFVASGIIFLNDAGILCFVMIPKILFVRQGLPEGVTVGQSVVREVMLKAMRRARAPAFKERCRIELDRDAPLSENAQSRGGTLEFSESMEYKSIVGCKRADVEVYNSAGDLWPNSCSQCEEETSNFQIDERSR